MQLTCWFSLQLIMDNHYLAVTDDIITNRVTFFKDHIDAVIRQVGIAALHNGLMDLRIERLAFSRNLFDMQGFKGLFKLFVDHSHAL